MRTAILDALPSDWSFANARVLDFGCGAGRVLRHFLPEASTAELWGCDIHEPSVRWMQQHLCPPLHAFRNADAAPLAQPDGSFNLIWALSVFPHITDGWSAWILELHRVLADGGLFLATFMGEGVSMHVAREPWISDRVGMNVVRPGHGWKRGGPMVQHSPWWIEAHWGRAFDIVDIHPFGFSRFGPVGQGWVLLRKKPVHLSPADLEWVDPNEAREMAAAQHNVRQIYAQLDAVYRSPGWRLGKQLRDAGSYPVNLARRLLAPAENLRRPD